MLFMSEFPFYTLPPPCGSQRLENRSGPCRFRTPMGAVVCASAVTRSEASSTPIELRPSVSPTEQMRPYASGRSDDADAPRDPTALASAARTIACRCGRVHRDFAITVRHYGEGWTHAKAEADQCPHGLGSEKARRGVSMHYPMRRVAIPQMAGRAPIHGMKLPRD